MYSGELVSAFRFYTTEVLHDGFNVEIASELDCGKHSILSIAIRKVEWSQLEYTDAFYYYYYYRLDEARARVLFMPLFVCVRMHVGRQMDGIRCARILVICRKNFVF